ncbi:MAG: hypothetical protein ACOYON_04615 [Fimbriimonas sp.]
MAKSVQNVKNSLKFKAAEKEGILSVRVGVKKYSLPVSARILTGGDFLFLSFSASSELYKVAGAELEPMDKDADAESAFEALNPGRKRRGRRSSKVELPDTLTEALKGIPSGFRLAFTPEGSPKLVKTRQRRKKA